MNLPLFLSRNVKRNILLSFVLTAPLWGAEDDWTLNNSFTLYGDYAYFKREQTHRHKLIMDSSKLDCNCRFPSCNTDGLVRSFGFESGFKVGASYVTQRTVWDFSYLWLPPWESHCSRSQQGALIFSARHPGFIVDFDHADHGSAEYTSQFQNSELNFFRYFELRHGNYFSAAWMLGLRYIDLRESLDVSFTKAGSKSSYKVHTTNHLPMPQIGGLLAWNPTSALSWDLLVKIGVGADWGEQKTFLGDRNNTVVVRDYEKSGFSTPFLIETGITLSYQPVSFLTLQAAYQVIFLSGVLLAPDQLVKSSNPTHRYRANGAPLIHGLTAGLGWSF